MGKRKNASDDEAGSSSDEESTVDISFDFFNPNPEVDYQAIKRLLKQLFQRDEEKFDLHELTELVLAQPQVGTTIKTDGLESDPFSFVTVLNMHIHHQKESIKSIAQYLLEVTAKSDPAFNATLNALFSQSDAHVGLVLSERLVNMPVQVIPPTFNMLADEIKSAVAENEPYNFTHLIFISRVYHLTPEEESMLVNSAASRRPRASSSATDGSKFKKARPQQMEQEIPRPEDGIYLFHPEDAITSEAALHSLNFSYLAPRPPLVEETRSRDSFGLDVRGRIMLVPGGGESLRQLGAKMSEVFGRG